jgi:hypothetical protein
MMVLSIIVIALLIAGLAFYLFVVGSQLTTIATNLEECAELVRTIVGHASVIRPGVEHINRTGGVVAGALPLLYGMAEGIVAGVGPAPERPSERPPARPASGRRRSRLHDSVGYAPGGAHAEGAHRRRPMPGADPAEAAAASSAEPVGS